MIVYPEVLRFVRVPLFLKVSSWPDEALLLNLHRCVIANRLVCDPIILWSFDGHCATEYYKHRHVGKCCHLLFRVTALNTRHITLHLHYSWHCIHCAWLCSINTQYSAASYAHRSYWHNWRSITERDDSTENKQTIREIEKSIKAAEKEIKAWYSSTCVICWRRLRETRDQHLTN